MSEFEVELHILNLDLTMIMKYNFKENFEINQSSFESDFIINENDTILFEDTIDNYKDTVIYYQCQQVLFKIDIIQKIVTQRVIQGKSCLLLRLLPVTKSEYDYYFQNSDKNNLLGYSNNEEDKLILFVVMDTKIFQINMYNLEIIREIDNSYLIKNNQSKLRHSLVQVFILPVKLKKKKTLSFWTFLIKFKGVDIDLFDWREQNLFNKQNLVYEEGDNLKSEDFQSRYLIHKVFFRQEYTFIQLRKIDKFEQNFCTFNLQISKRKGSKIYDYSFKFIQQEINQISSYYDVLNFYPPIFQKKQIAYPFIIQEIEHYDDDDEVIYKLGFFSHNKQGKYYLEKLQNYNYQILQNLNFEYYVTKCQSTVDAYQIIDLKVKLVESFDFPSKFSFDSVMKLNDNNNSKFLFNINKQELIWIQKDGIYPDYIYKLCSILPKKIKTEQEDDEIGNEIQDLKEYIKSYTNFQRDSQNNFYLPMIYKEDEQLYFGIYDLNRKQIISEKILLLKDQSLILSHFNEETKQFILLFENNNDIRSNETKYSYYYSHDLYLLQLDQDKQLVVQFKLLKENILNYSQVEKGSQNNYFLPIIFLENEKIYFGLYDFTMKKLIEGSRRLSQYTQCISSYYQEDTKQLILLFENVILNKIYKNKLIMRYLRDNYIVFDRRVKYDKQMYPYQLLLIPQTNILIVLTNDAYYYQPSVYYVIDTETNQIANVVEMVSTVYYIRYVPAIKSIIGINSSTFYVFDVYTMSIIQQAKVIDQGAQADNFIDTAIAVISSYKNIVVAYDIQQQRIINNYYSTYPITNFSCLTFLQNKHLVFMNDNSNIIIWNVDTGENFKVQKVNSNLNTYFVHLQNSYYVLVVVNSTKLQLIDYSQYEQGQTNLLYTLDTQDVLKNYNSVTFDSSQIVVKSMTISIQDQLQYNYLVVSHNGYQIIVFKMPKIFDKQSFQLQPIFASTIEFRSYIMPQNSLSFYLCGYNSIYVINFFNEVQPKYSQLLYFPSIQMPTYLALTTNNYEVYMTIFQVDVGMPTQSIFFQGSDQAGNYLFQTFYNYPFYLSYYSTSIVLNSNYGEIAYKIIYGGILIYSVSTQSYTYYNILNSQNWSQEVSNYIIIKNTNSYSFIEVNHLDGGKSVMILDLVTQQAIYFYPPDQSILGQAFTLNVQEQKLYAFNQQGTLHIWDFQGNHLSQQKLSSVKVFNMLKLQNLIVYVDSNKQLYQILDTEKTSKLIYQFSNVLTTFKYLDQINLIFAGEYQSGNIYGFKLNNNLYLLELFIQLKTLISQSVLDITFTPITKLLYISAEYSNIYFDISQCIQDIKSCLSCSLKFYISNSQYQYIQNNSYGQGLQNYPYTTYQNMIQIFLIAQRYLKIVVNIENIQTQIYTDFQYPLQLEQYILQFNFQKFIQLSFRPFETTDNTIQLSFIQLSGDFQFNNFQSIQFQNINFQFNVTNYQNCSLVFSSVVSQVVLDNIQIFSSDSSNLDYCNRINLINSNLILQNILMDSKTFKNLTYVTSIGTQQVKFQNFNLTNCKIGVFSVFSQQSHTILELTKLSIQGNKYYSLPNQNQQQTQSLFSAGQITLNQALIDSNYFLNTNIMQIMVQVSYSSLFFSLSDIIFSNNQFQTVSQSIFFSCLFSLLPQPDHQIIAQNIFVFNNDIVQNNKIENNQYFFTNLIQTNNINNITISNINITDNQYLSFLKSQDLNVFQLDNFECSYSNNYLTKYLGNPSSGCLSLQETKSIQLSNLNVSQKLAYDSNLIDILNQKVSQTQIQIYNSSFSNIQLFQSQQYNLANPLIIRSSYQNDILIFNCTFQNNILFGIPNSIAVSSSAIQIMNIVGTTTVNLTNFKNLSSNSDINGFYALSQNTIIISSTFDTTTYQQKQLKNSNQLSQQINLKGGSVNLKSQSVQIIQSVFKTSESHSGGFIYITSYSQTLKISITQSQFKDCFTKLNGGAIFVDTLGSTTELLISDSSFENIYQLNYQSSLIYINGDNIGKNAKINSFIQMNNTNFTNIFGEDITSIFSLTLSQLNIYKSLYQINLTNSQSSILPLDLFSNLHASTYVSSLRSEVLLAQVVISDIQDKYQKSQDHQMFFSSTSSNFKVNDCVIQDVQMNIGGLAFFDQGQVDIYNLKLSNIQYQAKNQRLLQPINSYLYQITSFQFSNSIVSISQSNISNIFCQNGCIGGFALIQQSQLNISNTNFTSIQSQSGGAITIQDPKLNVSISQCTFQDNLSNLNGGALQVVSNQVMVYNISIVKNIFKKNTAQNGYGGAIYFYSQNTTSNNLLTLQDNQINNNQAQIGGGIKYEGIVPVLINNNIQDNTATLYGQNTFSYPTKLKLENVQDLIQNNIQVFENKIVINQQRSGNSLPNMTFTLINDQGDVMKFVDSADQQQNFLTIQIDPQNSFYSYYYLRGEPKAGYVPQQNAFQFKNIDLIGKPLTNVKLMIKSNLIRDSNTSLLTNNYFFEIEAHIQDCQIGQIPQSYNNFQECVVCEKGTYSFDKTQCYKCPNGAECLGGSQIILDSGYWRNGEYDEDILFCEHLQENCVGGSYGNNICYKGHIGGLCEECDIFGEVWGESYAKSGKYQCTECSKIAHNQYIVSIVTLWTLISMEQTLYLCYLCQDISSQAIPKSLRNHFKIYWKSQKEQNKEKEAKRLIIRQKVQKILLNFKSMSIEQKRQLAINTYTLIIDEKLYKQEMEQLNLDKLNAEREDKLKLNDEKVVKKESALISPQSIGIKIQSSEKSLLSVQKNKPNEEDYQCDIEEKMIKDTQIEINLKKLQN
ncbi:hypothetical protein ABPG74_015061 [Tetrahymena malaccensis]